MHRKCQGEYGKVFTFLYTELYGTIAYAFEKKAWDLTVVLELFLEIYSAFTQEEIPAEKQVKEILVSYVNDYCQDMVENRIREAIDPENNFVVEMIMDSDLSDLSYLYQSGEYVSENELKTAEFMNSLSRGKLMRWHVLIQKAIGWDSSQEEKILQRRKRLIYVIILALSVW